MMIFLLGCWGQGADTDGAARFEVAPILAAPMPTPARFLAALPDEDSPYTGAIDAAELSRGICHGDADLRAAWLERVRGRLAAGSDPTLVGLQWGTLALGCTNHEFCAWARGVAESPELAPSERSIVASLSVSCSEPADLEIVSANLREAVERDDYPRVRGLVAVIQWQRDPSWVREQVRADLPLARSERARDALAMGLSQCGDDQSRGLVLDACVRRSGSEDLDEQRLFAPCGWYADLLGSPTLMPEDTDPSWVRHGRADPVGYAARHPEAAGRLVAQLDACVIDGMTGVVVSDTAETCLEALMSLDRPTAVLRSKSLNPETVRMTRLIEELRAFPTLPERNAAFAGAGLPPSTAGTITGALAASQRLADLTTAEDCRGQLDALLAIAPGVQRLHWEILGPTATGWTIDAWDGVTRLRGRATDDDERCESRGLVAVVNAALAHAGDPVRLGNLSGDPQVVVAADPATLRSADWLDIRIPARLPPTP